MSSTLRLLQRIVNEVKYLLLAFLLLITGCGMLYDHFEGKQFWDSLWWASVTATTVGYGDFYPKTTGGRVAGMMLMFGMVMFVLPILTALIVTRLIENHDLFSDDEQRRLMTQVEEIHTMLGETHRTKGLQRAR